MWWPIRPSAATREGLVKVLAVKLTWMRVKRRFVTRLQHAEEVSRRAETSELERCGKK